MLPVRKEMILDVSFIHPRTDTYVTSAAATDGAAAKQCDKTKMTTIELSSPPESPPTSI